MAAAPDVCCYLFVLVCEIEFLAVIVRIRHTFQLGKSLLGQRPHIPVHTRHGCGDLAYRPASVCVVVHTDQIFFFHGKVHHSSYLQFIFLGSGRRLFRAGGLFAVGKLLADRWPGLANTHITALIFVNHGIYPIGKLEDRNVFSMSGGEKQLLAFASVYAMNPQIYVLDEPSANLDMAGIKRLSERLRVIKGKGHAVVVAEHRLSWVQQFADRILYMKDGHIEREFTPSEFRTLSDSEREQLGLRSIVPEQIQIPEISGDLENAELKVCNLSFKRKKQMIVQNISLSARAGDIIGITGKNGAGKSTFCNCLCGLLKPKGGEILYQGKKLSEKARTKLFGMVMQEVNHQLFSDSVKNECLLANEDASEQEIRELLEKFDLEEYAEYHPMILSGGQRQRLAICQAVMGGKKLFIFDEPTSGLDFRHMCQVEKLMKRLAEEKYIIIVVTHDYEFLNRACKRYIRINS